MLMRCNEDCGNLKMLIPIIILLLFSYCDHFTYCYNKHGGCDDEHYYDDHKSATTSDNEEEYFTSPV